MDETEMAKRMAAVHRMAVTMAKTDGLISAKILSGSEFHGNPISEEALDAKNPVGKQSDGGRYFIHVRQDGRGQIMIHWPNGIEKTIKFLIPDDMLKDHPISCIPGLEKPLQTDFRNDGKIAPLKTPERGGGASELSKEMLLILLGMAVVCLFLALVKIPALWPYQISRWAICAGAGWCSYKTRSWRRGVLAVSAVLYNPIQPVVFGELWPWINGASTVAFLVILASLRKIKKETFKRAGALLALALIVAFGGWAIVAFCKKTALKPSSQITDAAPVDWWNWEENGRILREFEAAMDGPEAAIKEINAMEKEGALTDRAASERRWEWQRLDSDFFYRSVNETKQQKSKRIWVQTMALAYAVEKSRGVDLDSMDFVEAFRQVTQSRKDWKDARNWPSRKSFKDQYVSGPERWAWEDEWFPKLCAEFCKKLQIQKQAREELLNKFQLKLGSLNASEKSRVKQFSWSLEKVKHFVASADYKSWAAGVLTDDDAAWMKANLATVPEQKAPFVEKKLREYEALRNQSANPNP